MNFTIYKDIDNYVTRENSVPKPPEKGEIMICQICNKPIMPEHFSIDEYKRKREFKWHIHPKCFEYIDKLADKSVPGLLNERKCLFK
ncbi:hypothetical protein IR152_01125 [Clostridioides sp. ES-S-0108-01]|uniref:hypothetical protein n=1 Tax=unclassified Clostridioides TaxID=2635829 RepID=UPI001D0C685D|nr:hypothetical protein [Clostridioides sp. ES-S-0171-01]MCC0687911.1 hypothetical protein [Clostridioides sp. ES-S-0056-01]MCC0714607.1 hypothetical protein [Clostridioides sp. ES-S-0077-01]MCC0781756.1 hypothetical protein [Clostridioides sp. ES-S-0108-01]UDN49940.1 hypothetical protein JJC16_11215 [Clostridioides sp. ES-S-0107-01]UDN53401.1 hypothetical protein JJC02_10840 [Clostridioides sp. ES-S-0054-01]